MLCTTPSHIGDICTNRCGSRQSCEHIHSPPYHKIPFLVETNDRLVSGIKLGSIDGIPTIAYKTYAVSPQAIENGFSEELSPSRELRSEKPKTQAGRKPSFYSNLRDGSPMDAAPSPLTPIICAYPECSNMIWITVQQKRQIKTYNVLKYHDSHDPYCSVECQQKHFRDLEDAKCFEKTLMKNREYALVIHGAEEYLTKRQTEMEIHLITGNHGEQLARALRDKLISTTERQKRRYLTSKEVQTFLLTDIPRDIRPKDKLMYRAAWRVMNKCKLLFPNDISLGPEGKFSREIEFIGLII